MLITRSIRSGVDDEAGTGIFPTVAGVAVVLTLLLFAVQVCFDLYATSAVTAIAHDAARSVAGADSVDRIEARSEAEAKARDALGQYGGRTSFTWSSDGDSISVRVVAQNPGFLPFALRRPLSLDSVDRTVTVRLERLR